MMSAKGGRSAFGVRSASPDPPRAAPISPAMRGDGGRRRQVRTGKRAGRRHVGIWRRRAHEEERATRTVLRAATGGGRAGSEPRVHPSRGIDVFLLVISRLEVDVALPALPSRGRGASHRRSHRRREHPTPTRDAHRREGLGGGALQLRGLDHARSGRDVGLHLGQHDRRVQRSRSARVSMPCHI